MRITWNGHSNFFIQGKESSVIIDPFFANPKLKPASWKELTNLKMVLLTHDHLDHLGDGIEICKATGAKLGCEFVTGQKLQSLGLPEELTINHSGFNIGGTITHADIRVTMLPAFHSSFSGVPVGYIVHLDGKSIYHSGDTCVFSDMGLFAELYPVDLAILPVGGVYTMDAVQAAKACQLLKVKEVLPMHYATFPGLAQNTKDFKEQLAQFAPACRCLDLDPGQTLDWHN